MLIQPYNARAITADEEHLWSAVDNRDIATVKALLAKGVDPCFSTAA